MIDSVGPVVPTSGTLRPVPLTAARLTGGFWGRRQAVNSTDTLAHCFAWMRREGWAGNFTASPTERRGREFADSEIYKLTEALCWDSVRNDHTAEIAELAGLARSAQAPDGYLSTAYGRPGQPPRYHDLNFGHELYCAGHLLQAAAAAARTGASPELVDVARRAADHICTEFADGGNPGVCGHPEMEPGLVELYRVTGEERYLDQARRFVERRGHRSLPEHEFGWAYFQDDVPVRKAEVFRGHAVRALYLAMGAVDVAVETGDGELLSAVQRQFDRTLSRRTYLTGGMGSRHLDESFGDDFVLPADRSYVETCAGVATVMLAHRLLLATGETRYGDIVERVLFNVIATAVADDGRSFFYANTLHQRTPTVIVPTDRPQLRFGGGPRAPWFEVSCCLPNVGRLLASLETYLVTENDAGAQVHQYADLDVTAGGLGLEMRTYYPDEGSVTITVTDPGPAGSSSPARELTLRVPAWAAGATLTENGSTRPVHPGQVRVARRFTPGETLRLDLPVRPRWTFPDPRIDAVRGCVAVEAGPLVMCAESVDLETPSADLDSLAVDTSVAPEDGAVKGWFIPSADRPWPYGSEFESGPRSPRVVPLIPYHRWARRGPTTMRVWLPTTPP
ncbi:glycoside hydrolase family 127 protein [Virgisporangium aurantiacum]